MNGKASVQGLWIGDSGQDAQQKVRSLSRAELTLHQDLKSGVWPKGATTKFHGTPITPYAVLELLEGFDFCVSFFRPDQIEFIIRICRSFFIDNGAYSAWRKGIILDAAYIARYYDFVRKWIDYCTWFAIFDVIDGGTQEQDALIRETPPDLLHKAVPVWHMDEPISRFLRLADKWPRVAIGSSGEYRDVGSRSWRERQDELWDETIAVFGEVPKTHMFRGMQTVKSDFDYPFDSVDSADVGINHHLPQNNALAMVCRWESMNCPTMWNGRVRPANLMG